MIINELCILINIIKLIFRMLEFKTLITSLSLFLIILSSCNSKNQTHSPKENLNKPTAVFSDQLKTKSGNNIIFDKGVYCGFLDSKGILWFGSNGSGVYSYDGKSYTHFTEDNGLPNNKVCTIMEDKAGNIWFGTAKGLCRYDRKNFTHIPIPQSDISGVWLDKVYPIVNPNQVMSILEDKNGDFWIGTNGAGVYRYDGETFTQYLSNEGKVYEDGLQHNIVLSITEDLSGNIWFTSLSHAGVISYDGITFTHYTTKEGLSDNFIRTSFCDRAGNIWIGTHGNRNGGLDRFDGKKFTNFHKTDDGLPLNNVQWIYEDKSGNLWLGSGNSNLSIFNGNVFKEFTAKDGRRFDRVLFILDDEKGSIWFGGLDGLWKIEGENVIDMISNKNI